MKIHSLILTVVFGSLGFGLAEAANSFKSTSKTEMGVDVTLSFPLSAPVSGFSLGALVCSADAQGVLPLKSAQLWMDHDGKGHAGPRVSPKALSASCYQLNGVNFPHAGEWQVRFELSNGDKGLFKFNVEAALAPGVALAKGDKGSAGSLRFDGGTPSGSTNSAVFCTNQLAALTLAELWMPDMGHGSSPTTLNPVGEGCSEVTGIDFFMPGKWEIRSEISSGEKFVFVIGVQ